MTRSNPPPSPWWKVAAIGVAMMSGCAFALGLWQVIR